MQKMFNEMFGNIYFLPETSLQLNIDKQNYYVYNGNILIRLRNCAEYNGFFKI